MSTASKAACLSTYQLLFPQLLRTCRIQGSPGLCHIWDSHFTDVETEAKCLALGHSQPGSMGLLLLSPTCSLPRLVPEGLDWGCSLELCCSLVTPDPTEKQGTSAGAGGMEVRQKAYGAQRQGPELAQRSLILPEMQRKVLP